MTPTQPDSRRFFSYDEANRTLPLVRRIVEDIVTRYRALEPAIARYKLLPAAERKDGPGRELKREIDAAVQEVEELVDELHSLGCRFKGLREGLVDWFSYYAGRPVFLCWKLGEPEIGYWHQLDAGFVGRQPILPGQAGNFRAEQNGDDGSGS